MTTELTPCPDCGEPSNNGRACRLCESEDAMHSALTTYQPAQAGEVDDSKLLNGFSHDALVSELIKASGRRDVLHASHMGKGMSDADYTEFSRLRDQYIPALRSEIIARITTQPAAQDLPDAVAHYGTVDDLPAAQATPFPFAIVADPSIPPGQAVVKQAGQEVGRIVNIGASQPATPPQQAAGEPEHHRQAWAALTDACQRVATADGSSAADLTRAIDRFTDVLMGDTHPAPAVPEDVQRNATRWEEVLRQVGADRQCGGFRFTLYNLRPIPGSNPMQGAVCQHFTQAVDAMLAAAQAKGGCDEN